jgi:hypothetical protein
MKAPLMKVSRRPGAVAPLMALLAIPLLGMAAFSIDLGYLVLVQTDLQNAADAAALAGAEQMQNLFVQYYAPGQTFQDGYLTYATTNVKPTGSVSGLPTGLTPTTGSPMWNAKLYGKLNTAGGVNIHISEDDITFGYTDSSGSYSTTYTGFPNTIQVIARRDDEKNGSVGLFFGPVFNKDSQSLRATARATIYTGDVTSLQKITGLDAHILPVALDVNIWDTFYSTGVSPDGTIHTGSNGNPQLHVYPNSTNTPGSFGLIDVGPAQNNSPAFSTWIDSGQTPNDIQYLLDNSLLPVSMSAPQAWKVGPGLKSTLLSDFQSQMGKSMLIPLFTPASTLPYTAASGNGQGATYAIVGFAGVAISQADGNGGNMDISLQPAAGIDATSVLSNMVPAGESTASVGGYATTFISAKITY